MANDNTARGKQEAEADTIHGAQASRKRKNARPTTIGGSAIPGAKSTLPREHVETSNPQQQQQESYNRMMRRRMERMGMNDQDKHQLTAAEQRKKRATRLKERRDQQLASVRRNLPGGKIDANPRRVYYMILGVTLALVALIVVFVILRSTGVLH